MYFLYEACEMPLSYKKFFMTGHMPFGTIKKVLSPKWIPPEGFDVFPYQSATFHSRQPVMTYRLRPAWIEARKISYCHEAKSIEIHEL